MTGFNINRDDLQTAIEQGKICSARLCSKPVTRYCKAFPHLSLCDRCYDLWLARNAAVRDRQRKRG